MHRANSRRPWHRLLPVCLFLLFITACGTPIISTEAPVAAIPSSSASVQADPTTPSATPTPTPSVAPSATASPSATPTPEPPAESPTAEPVVTETPPAPFDPALAAELQAILDATVADGAIPGAVLAVSVPGQEPWTGASGVADRQQALPMEPSTNVRIASISKIFTAVVVLQLVEEGRIDLNATLADYLPGLVPASDTITVRDLLRHQTGLYDYLEDRNFVARAYEDPDRRWEPRELVEYATRFPLLFRPGAEGAWDYSSTNYVLLGMIVEQVTGNGLGAEMRARIFEPLGLERTYFAPDEGIPSTMARGYSRATDRSDAAMSFVFATANLVSTAGDVQRFMTGLLGGELLAAESLDRMLTFVSGQGQYNMPALEYGLGIMRNRLPVGPGPDGAPRPPEVTTVVGHIGGYAGFRSAVWAAPESGITLALGVNQASTDPNILATAVFDALLRHQGR